MPTNFLMSLILISTQGGGTGIMKLFARELLGITQRSSFFSEDPILEGIFEIVKECPNFELRNETLLSLIDQILSYQVPQGLRLQLERFAECAHTK